MHISIVHILESVGAEIVSLFRSSFFYAAYVPDKEIHYGVIKLVYA